MRRHSSWFCLIALGAIAGGARAGDAESELAKLQGEWKLVSHTLNGVRMADERAAKW